MFGMTGTPASLPEFLFIDNWIIGMDRIHKIAERIVATRPIKLDRSVIERLVDKVLARMKGWSVREDGDAPLLDTFWFKDTIDIETVKGESVSIIVQVLSRKGTSTNFILGGGSGKTVKTREPAVVIDVNGSYSADDFIVAESSFKRDLSSILYHELTHQADIMKKQSGPTSNKIMTEEDFGDKLDEYYNHPNEVRAYMREIFEDMRQHLRTLVNNLGDREAIRKLLKFSKTWKQIEPHLTDSNRRLIEKGVYQAVQDWIEEQNIGKAANVS
jgi:hypothetical protein